MSTELQTGDAIIVVDVQNDFCAGGALPVENGDHVVPVLNRWIANAGKKNVPVYASRDWHPFQHLSFAEQGGPWPEHCVQDSRGAEFHPELTLPKGVKKISKGVRFDQDQYSAFDETGLARHLTELGITRLWIGGLAQEVCVRATVLDACKAGFEVHLIPDATRAITATDGEQALNDMREAGAHI